MLDLDAVAKRWDLQPDPDDGSPRAYRVSTGDVDDVAYLVAELRAAREIGYALERWVAIPGMFWGDTPETGSEVGAALTNWQKVTGEGS